MALTLTSLMRLPQWLSGTDVPTRVEFNDAFATIDAVAARFQVGLESGRDVDGAGGFYYATDTGVMWFFDGTDESSWRVVGRVIQAPQVIRQDLGQFAFIEMHDNSGNVVGSFDTNGNYHLTANENPTALGLPPDTRSYPGFSPPGYYRSAEGLIKMTGAFTGSTGSSYTFSVPRPRDLANHFWLIPSGGGQSIQAFLTGSIGQLQIIGLVGGVAFLDPISYIAERA
jgi:hypothetical protein